MRFGKHKGEEIADLPDDYFDWLANLDELREPTCSAVLDEIDRRMQRRSRSGPTMQKSRFQTIQLDVGHLPIIREVLDRGYRAAALACHPDHGGNADTMVRLNSAVDSVRKQLSALQEACR